MTFWFQVPLSFFWLTKEKKLVWQSSKEAPFVCRLMLVIVHSFCSLSPTSHHFEMIWKGLKTRKSKKMCLSSYSLMAVVETQQAVARPGSDWSSSVSARLWLVQTGHVTGASKDGRLAQLARDLERVIFGNYHQAMLEESLYSSCFTEDEISLEKRNNQFFL